MSTVLHFGRVHGASIIRDAAGTPQMDRAGERRVGNATRTLAFVGLSPPYCTLTHFGSPKMSLPARPVETSGAL